MIRSPELAPTLVVVLVAAVWGCWWIPLRGIVAYGLVGPWGGAIIYLLAVAVLLPFAIAGRWLGGPGSRPALVIGFLYGVQLSAFSYGIVIGEVMRVTLLYYLLPIWGTLFAVLLLGERLTALRIAAVAFGLAGAAVVLGGSGSLPLPRSPGDWLGLATGVFFALATALSRKRPEAKGLATTFVTFASAALVSAGFAMFLPAGHAPTMETIASALPLAFLFVVAVAIPSYALMIWAAGRIDSGRISILLLLEVVVATLSSSVLLGEPFGIRQAIGCLLIMAAGTLSGIDQMRGQRLAPAEERDRRA